MRQAVAVGEKLHVGQDQVPIDSGEGGVAEFFCCQLEEGGDPGDHFRADGRGGKQTVEAGGSSLSQRGQREGIALGPRDECEHVSRA